MKKRILIGLIMAIGSSLYASNGFMGLSSKNGININPTDLIEAKLLTGIEFSKLNEKVLPGAAISFKNRNRNCLAQGDFFMDRVTITNVSCDDNSFFKVEGYFYNDSKILKVNSTKINDEEKLYRILPQDGYISYYIVRDEVSINDLK